MRVVLGECLYAAQQHLNLLALNTKVNGRARCELILKNSAEVIVLGMAGIILCARQSAVKCLIVWMWS